MFLFQNKMKTHCRATTVVFQFFQSMMFKKLRSTAINHKQVNKHKDKTCCCITKGFNNTRLPQCPVAANLNMNKVFDTMNIHKITQQTF